MHKWESLKFKPSLCSKAPKKFLWGYPFGTVLSCHLLGFENFFTTLGHNHRSLFLSLPMDDCLFVFHLLSIFSFFLLQLFLNISPKRLDVFSFHLKVIAYSHAIYYDLPITLTSIYLFSQKQLDIINTKKINHYVKKTIFKTLLLICSTPADCGCFRIIVCQTPLMWSINIRKV